MTAPAKRVKKKPTKAPRISITETKMVKLAELSLYHKNPRQGNVEAIAESLDNNGQYRAIVVNKGTQTGRKNEILAGNHTYLGAKKLGWPDIMATFVDVDEDQATKIVLADNKTADLGSYDEKLIADLFSSLPDVTGTGYSEAEMQAILKDAEDAAITVLTGLEEEENEQREEEQARSFDGTGLGEDDDDSFDAETDEFGDPVAEPKGPEVANASDDIGGTAALKPDLPIDRKYYTGYWGIPALRNDMLVRPEDIPDNLDSWAGSACKDWPDPDQWWLYNWGIDSTSGMRDVSKVIVSFYCWDDYFVNWFVYPNKYVAKLLNSKIKMMICPNYSQWPEDSKCLNLIALYKSRYVGRYAQEAGIKVIPDLTWPGGETEWLKEHVLPTMPKNPPVVAMQLQTNSADYMDVIDPKKEPDAYKMQQAIIGEIQYAFDYLKPEAVLLYSTDKGLEWFKKHSKYEGKIIYVETRMKKLAERAKKKEKKTTI